MTFSSLTRLHLLLCPLLFCGTLFCIGCSKQQEAPRLPNPEDFHVTVSTGGHPVQDFEHKLVHYVTLSPQQLQKFYDPETKELKLPFDGIMEVDIRGDAMGFRVVDVYDPSETALLGFQDGDIVTAVDRLHTTNIGDLDQLFLLLKTEEKVTVTLQRGGEPHKIIYVVQKTSRS